MARIALAFVFAAMTAAAWSADEADWVVRDFKFHTGEVLPELGTTAQAKFWKMDLAKLLREVPKSGF